MKAIYYIAKKEVKSSFSSPKAGVVFTVFLLLIGLFFKMFMNQAVQVSANPQHYGGGGINLNDVFNVLFSNVHFLFLFFVPAVTMGLFADEKKNQTIKFLYSSPVSIWEIVLGKYFSVMFVMVLMLLGTLVYPIYACFHGDLDVGIWWSSYLGLVLLVSAQLSLGVWISSVTKTQFLSCVSTIICLFLLLILGWASRSIAGGGLGGFLEYISFTSHFDNFLKGMISTTDVVYFLTFTVLFLYYTYVSLDSQRWS